MISNKQELEQQVETVVQELLKVASLGPNRILVIGISTSEVLGHKIGTAGSEDVADAIYSALDRQRSTLGFHLAFQCCEHLNRALVVERETAERFGLEEVTAVPVRKAGGAMASFAYGQMKDPVLVEKIAAHAGIDIGDTLIGMHLRPVAIPVRPSIRKIGNAHITMAYTRPKLIGGIRAVYERP
ncbi:MAG TPA: TIGR01440 family protein [Bacillota bacterium]|nr:TIGR01440 family protein [Bacillota bacterium]